MTSKILVIAAHPDDEVLGCGGTLARHATEGDEVHILILAEGVTSRDQQRDAAGRDQDLAALRRAAEGAAQCLGARPPLFAGFPDNRMDSLDLLNIVKEIEKVISETAPDIVYTHHGADLNQDHRLTHQAVLTACRPLPQGTVQAIYAFETVSSSEWGSAALGPTFIPNRFVDIAAHLDHKLKALDSYEAEMRPFPHARSRENIAALARYRGASAGLDAAEAFLIVREVVA